MTATQDVTFEGPGARPQRGALALPTETDGPAPAVLVLHEIFGLNNDMRRIAGRFADEGYVALAPSFFDTPGLRALCIMRAIRSLKSGRGPNFDLLEAARSYLVARPDVDPDRIGAVGFCMGGGFAVLLAARAPLQVVATFYGDVPAKAKTLKGICPVVGGFGDRDRVFGPNAARLRSHLDELGVPYDIKSYPDAGHSYMSHSSGVLATLGRYSPMAVDHHEAACADSWTRMLGFFDEHLAR